MELINKTDIPSFPGEVGNAVLHRILISQAPTGSNEPHGYVCARGEKLSPKATLVCYLMEPTLPMMPLGWSWPHRPTP